MPFTCPNCKRVLPTAHTVHNCMRVKRSDYGKKRHVTPPRVRRVVIAFHSAYDTGDASTEAAAECVTDMLTDLRHFCDWRSLTFADLDRSAHSHYLHERAEDGQ